jgi:hypothetical protein
MTAKYSGKIVWKGTAATPDATKYSGMVGHDIENNIYYHSNGTTWLPSANWADGTGTALVRPDETLVYAGLGPMTWAEALTAFPIGGEAIAALPAGVTVLVVDAAGWSGLFVKNPAGTRLRPLGRLTIKSTATPVVNTTDDGAQKDGASCLFPAGLLEVGGRCAMFANASGALNTNQKILRTYVHNTATYGSGNQPSGSASHTSAANPQFFQYSGFLVAALSNISIHGDNGMATATGLGSLISTISSSDADITGVYMNTTMQLNAGGVSMTINSQAWYYEPPAG